MNPMFLNNTHTADPGITVVENNIEIIKQYILLICGVFTVQFCSKLRTILGRWDSWWLSKL